MSSMSESTWTAAVAGRPPNRARHERLLRMFVRIEPGEARCFLLFFVYAFLVLVSWYIVRTLREPLLLVDASPEVRRTRRPRQRSRC
jgi:ATP/ADP translocase